MQLARIAAGLGLGTGGQDAPRSNSPAKARHGPAKASDAEVDAAIATMGLPVFRAPLSAEDEQLLAGLPLR